MNTWKKYVLTQYKHENNFIKFDVYHKNKILAYYGKS